MTSLREIPEISSEDELSIFSEVDIKLIMEYSLKKQLSRKDDLRHLIINCLLDSLDQFIYWKTLCKQIGNKKDDGEPIDNDSLRQAIKGINDDFFRESKLRRYYIGVKDKNSRPSYKLAINSQILNHEITYNKKSKYLLSAIIVTFIILLLSFSLARHFRVFNFDKTRVMYFRLSGHAVDFLINNKFDPQWHTILSENCFLIKNKTYDQLRYLMDNYSYYPLSNKANENNGVILFLNSSIPFPDSQKSSDNNINNTEKVVGYDYNRHGRFLIGTGFSLSFGMTFYNSINKPDYLIDVFNNDETWSVNVKDYDNFLSELNSRNIILDNLIFWKYANKRDIQSIDNRKAIDFYNFITNNNFPSDLFVKLLTVNRDYCSFDSPYLETTTFPYLNLNVVVIENITQYPLNIGEFKIKENVNKTLRSKKTDENEIATIKILNRASFSPQKLLPGEKIIIPLNLTFTQNAPYYTQLNDIADLDDTINTVFSDYPDSGKLNIYDNQFNAYDKKIGTITVAKLINRLKISHKETLRNTDYIFGPSMEVYKIKIDGKFQSLRRINEDYFYIIDSFEGASCPYIYTYNTDKHQWELIGKLIEGNNGKSNEKMHIIRLYEFDGRLLIKEMEHETSYIDYMVIKIKYGNNYEMILKPNVNQLLNVDDNYLVLKYNDNIIIKFSGDIPENVSSIYLQSYGYFEEEK